MTTFHTGDSVEWNTSQGSTHGTVVSTHTEDLEFEGQTFRASPEDPVHIVESERTGSRAAHHERALRARS